MDNQSIIVPVKVGSVMYDLLWQMHVTGHNFHNIMTVSMKASQAPAQDATHRTSWKKTLHWRQRSGTEQTVWNLRRQQWHTIASSVNTNKWEPCAVHTKHKWNFTYTKCVSSYLNTKQDETYPCLDSLRKGANCSF